MDSRRNVSEDCPDIPEPTVEISLIKLKETIRFVFWEETKKLKEEFWSMVTKWFKRVLGLILVPSNIIYLFYFFFT